MLIKAKHLASCATVLLALCGQYGIAEAMSLKDAVTRAVESNPDIGEAIANREGIQFELEQANGLYRPRVDLEGSAGGEIRDSNSTRSNGDQDHLFFRREASLVVRQLLFDGFGTEGEVERQASRVDSASFRVYERSEFISLAVIREYLEIIRLTRIIELSKENTKYLQGIQGQISQGAGGGAFGVADLQQAEERVFASRAQFEDFKEQLLAAQATFIKLVGQPIGRISKPINALNLIPKSLEATLAQARAQHPSIKFAQADIDAAAALVKVAESRYYPNVSLVGRAVAADDVDGQYGFDGDLRADVVVKWNLYNGGIDTANKQEQIRHVDETYQALHRITREVEEGVRLSWDRQMQQTLRLRQLLRVLSSLNQLRDSYFEQFKIGERSLLDLLDTQNNRFAAQIAVATADATVKFGHFRILASNGSLLKTLGVAAPPQAETYARNDEKVPETPAADSFVRVDPPAPLE